MDAATLTAESDGLKLVPVVALEEKWPLFQTQLCLGLRMSFSNGQLTLELILVYQRYGPPFK